VGRGEVAEEGGEDAQKNQQETLEFDLS
jgi:hypothetical protein